MTVWKIIISHVLGFNLTSIGNRSETVSLESLPILNAHIIMRPRFFGGIIWNHRAPPNTETTPPLRILVSGETYQYYVQIYCKYALQVI